MELNTNTNEKEFLRELALYRAECESALELTLTKLGTARRLIDLSNREDPFDRIESRVKTVESILGKCEIRGYDRTIESIKDNIHDIAGLRVVTTFRDEIPVIEDLIHQIPGVNVVKRKDYITAPKTTGYKSLHLGCQVEIFTPQGTKLLPVEVQIRDKAMNLWATIEHKVRYKKTVRSPKAADYFTKMARILDEFADVAIELRDYEEESA